MMNDKTGEFADQGSQGCPSRPDCRYIHLFVSQVVCHLVRFVLYIPSVGSTYVSYNLDY